MTGGASAPQPSSSTFASFGASERSRGPVKGLKRLPPPPLLRVGVKTGFEDTGGWGPLLLEDAAPAEYLEPEASDTFWTIDSGVRSRSERAVIWTW